MNTGFSNRMKDVFTYVREEVIRLGDENIGVEHLFYLIMKTYADGSDHNESYVFASNFLTKIILVRGG